MRNPAWEPQESTRLEHAPLVADLVVERSLQHDDHLVLNLVHMKRRPTGVDDALEDGQEPMGLLSGDLERQALPPPVLRSSSAVSRASE